MPSTQLAPAHVELRRLVRSGPRPDVIRHGWDIPLIAVVITCAVSAAVAAGLSMTVFSHLSVNNDESVYLLQAKTIANGYLFPPVGHPPASFTPWLGVTHGGHYVLKYIPVVASFLAASVVLTGGYVAALAFWASALAAATFLLAKEATGNRGTAATSAVLAAGCPLTIVQSALALPYVPFVVLVEISLWGLLAGTRQDSLRLLMVSGGCAGLAFAARSFDALLMLAPAMGWLLWQARSRRRRLIGGVLAGAALPGGALLWFNYAATGSVLRLPFSLFESGDTLGFGVHRLYPEDPARQFGLAQGWQGLARHLSLLGGGWAFGGVLLAILVGLAFIRRKVPAACVAILAGGVLLTVGYLFFWGTWNAAIVWGGVRYLGPYYLMPLLVPLSIVGAIGIRTLVATTKWLAIAVCLAASALSSLILVPALNADAALNADNGQLANAVSAQGRALVFVDTYPSYLQHPTAVISNASPPGGRTVYALHAGGDDFAVLRSFPGRPMYELQLLGEYGKQPHAGYGARLQGMRLIAGPTLTVKVRARVPDSVASARLEVSVAGRQLSSALTPGQTAAVQLTFSAGSPGSAGSAADRSTPGLAFQQVDPGSGGAVTLRLLTGGPGGGGETASRLRLPMVRTASGLLNMLAPAGSATELGPIPPPALSVETASARGPNGAERRPPRHGVVP
jgi:hypothetical protein